MKKRIKEKTKVVSFRLPLSLTNPFIEFAKKFLQQNNIKDIEITNQLTKDEDSERHKKLINLYFRVPKFSDSIISIELMTATDVSKLIERKSGEKLSYWKTGRALKELGYIQEVRKFFGKTQRLYKVEPINQ